jgi:DNA-binding transcriptional MerR regulator
MLKIGEFSKFGQVSVKTSRYYDSLGLLTPQMIDPITGDRYYSFDLLPRLNRILALKEFGFSLEQIDQLLNNDLTAEQLRGMLRLKQAEIRSRWTRKSNNLITFQLDPLTDKRLEQFNQLLLCSP